MYVSLSVEPSSSRAGYFFDKTQGELCFCYPYIEFVHCNGDYVEIKIRRLLDK